MAREGGQPVYDKPEQLSFVEQGLLAGERLVAVYDCKGVGSGFVGVTDRRVILEDRSFVGRRIAVISIPYSRIASVAMVSDRSILGDFFGTSEVLIVTAGGTQHTAEFRGPEKARHVHDMILWAISSQSRPGPG
jgi:hypothetical protein